MYMSRGHWPTMQEPVARDICGVAVPIRALATLAGRVTSDIDTVTGQFRALASDIQSIAVAHRLGVRGQRAAVHRHWLDVPDFPDDVHGFPGGVRENRPRAA